MSEAVLLVAASTRAMAESAIRSGYAPRCVDCFGDLDQRSLVPVVTPERTSGEPWGAAALVGLAERVPAAAVAYGGALENSPEAVARLSQGRELLGNGRETLTRVRDPDELAAVLRAAGLSVPRRLGSAGIGPEDARLRWLRKSRRSAGGTRVRSWRPGDALGTDEIVQEYVEGTPASAVAVADGGKAIVLGLSRQLVGIEAFGAAGFRYCGSIVPLTADEDEFLAVLAQLQSAAEALAAAFGLRGLFGIDFVSDRGTAFVLEVNPRYTASVEVVERARGFPFFDLHVRGCRGRLPDVEPLRPHRGPVEGKAILFARRPLALGDTRSWLAQGVRDVPVPGSRIAKGSPICTIFATATNPVACERELRAIAAAHESSLGPPPRAAEVEAGMV